jgi:transposase
MDKKNNRVYDKEFKLNSVKLFKESKKSINVYCKDLGVPLSTFHSWLSAFDKNGAAELPGSGNIKGSNLEVFKLKKELADITEERNILKKALAIFSRAKV